MSEFSYRIESESFIEIAKRFVFIEVRFDSHPYLNFAFRSRINLNLPIMSSRCKRSVRNNRPEVKLIIEGAGGLLATRKNNSFTYRNIIPIKFQGLQKKGVCDLRDDYHLRYYNLNILIFLVIFPQILNTFFQLFKPLILILILHSF